MRGSFLPILVATIDVQLAVACFSLIQFLGETGKTSLLFVLFLVKILYFNGFMASGLSTTTYYLAYGAFPKITRVQPTELKVPQVYTNSQT
jgi:hypothetical protein